MFSVTFDKSASFSLAHRWSLAEDCDSAVATQDFDTPRGNVMALEDGKVIADIFEKVYRDPYFHLGELSFADFVNAAVERGTKAGVSYKDKDCRSQYGPGNPEILSGFLSVMFGEYAARIIAQKAEDGHNDKQKPSPMHRAMLGDLRRMLEQLVSEIRHREEGLW